MLLSRDADDAFDAAAATTLCFLLRHFRALILVFAITLLACCFRYAGASRLYDIDTLIPLIAAAERCHTDTPPLSPCCAPMMPLSLPDAH